MNKRGALEALLFIHGEPISLKKAAGILNLTPEDLKTSLLELEADLKNEFRGVYLLLEESLEKTFESKDWGSRKVQLATRPEFSDILSEFIKSEMSEELTPAALEVASLIAYLGPISRARIEYIRGVNSVFTLRGLLMRGLVEKMPDPASANTFLYKPSFDLLKHLGVSSKEELPEYQKFQELINREIQ